MRQGRYGTPSRSQIGASVLGEDDVGVQRPVAVGLPLADERDRPGAFAEPLHRKHLAGPAADALGMAVRVAQARPAVEDHLVRDDRQVAEPRPLEDRSDVEREAVGDELERQAPLLRPGDERREGGVELRVSERVGEHLLARAVQHRRLVAGGLAQPHLAAVDGLVVGLPARLAEGGEEHLGDVLQAGGAVEVDDERADGQHAQGSRRATRSARATRSSSSPRLSQIRAGSTSR